MGFGKQPRDDLKVSYYRARYYDPSSGRFLSEDSTRYWGGINLYRYAENNPVLRRDSFGLNSGSGGGCGGRPSAPKGKTPITGGIVVGGTVAGGPGSAGSSIATGSVGIVGPLFGAPSALIETGGWATAAGNYLAGSPNPNSDGIPWAAVIGSYYGGGVGLTVSNGLPCQLAGPFHTINFDLGVIANGGVSLSFNEAGVWEFSFQLPGYLPSAGFGGALSFTNTSTPVQPF